MKKEWYVGLVVLEANQKLAEEFAKIACEQLGAVPIGDGLPEPGKWVTGEWQDTGIPAVMGYVPFSDGLNEAVERLDEAASNASCKSPVMDLEIRII